MTVLWILLGLLAALLLLLCCPVTLRLSWWPAAASKRDEPSGCLTEQVERDLEQLGLAPEDEQQLRRLIQGLPDPPPQQPQKELRLTLHCLFLRLTLYPQKPKPPKEPKQPARKKKPRREKQVEEKKEKPDTAAILRMIPEIVNCAKKPLEMALGDLCLHHLQLYAAVGPAGQRAGGAGHAKICVGGVYRAGSGAELDQGQARGHPPAAGLFRRRGEQLGGAAAAELSPHRDAGGGAAVCVLPAAAVAGAEEKGTAGRTEKTDSLRYGFIKIQKGMVV